MGDEKTINFTYLLKKVNIMNITDMISGLKKILSFSNTRTPSIPLPLRLAASKRSGLSATKITQEVLKEYQALGIPVGPLPDGTLNLNDICTKIIIEKIVDALKNDARIEIAVEPKGTITASGVAGPGLPVQVTGIVISIQGGAGVIQ